MNIEQIKQRVASARLRVCEANGATDADKAKLAEANRTLAVIEDQLKSLQGNIYNELYT